MNGQGLCKDTWDGEKQGWSLLIGCGGAGIAAMREAVRLLAVRSGGLERVACLAVDADFRCSPAGGRYNRTKERGERSWLACFNGSFRLHAQSVFVSDVRRNSGKYLCMGV